MKYFYKFIDLELPAKVVVPVLVTAAVAAMLFSTVLA